MSSNRPKDGPRRVGITGQAGFIGTHLAEYVVKSDGLTLVPFSDSYFHNEALLRGFVRDCDIIVHLAAASRMPSEEELYELNVGLVQQVVDAMEAEDVAPLVMFSSSTHEIRDTAYGRAKLEGRRIFENWAKEHGASFVGFVFPNIYGPGAKVHYASFIATFAWELQHNVEPKIMVDALMKLKYVGNLCKFIGDHFSFDGIARVEVPHDFELRVTDVLGLFKMFMKYDGESMVNDLAATGNLGNLYRTFLSYRE